MRPAFLQTLTKSLTAKLVIAVSLVIILNSIIFWYMMVEKEKTHLMEDALHSTSASSEIVKKSIRHDMLHGRSQDLQTVLEAIGATKYVEIIRVVTLNGRIVYSSVRQEVGKVLSQNSPECRVCHQGLKKVLTFDGKPQWTISESDSTKTLTYVDPIHNEPDCFTAVCHAHPPEQNNLGLLVTNYSLSRYDELIKSQVFNITLYTLFFVGVVALLMSVILWQIVLKPVRSLSEAMKKVSSGEFLYKVAVPSEDEIGRLADTFNEMTAELYASRTKMEEWTQSLEVEVEKKTAEIRKTQDKLVQAEKMAALGRLTADIAHQIRNPLAALGGFGRRLKKLATSEKQESYAEVVVSEAERLERILRDVLVFSWETIVTLQRVVLHEIVKDCVEFYREICQEQGIEINFTVATDLALVMDHNHVRQAINNLLANAIDAMPSGGVLGIEVVEEELHQVIWGVVHISDDGPGVPEELLARIVEPFYTTKRSGLGTGLGLPISKKIIEEHRGFLRIANRIEGGLRVSIYFPRQSEAENLQEPCWQFMQCGREKNGEIKCPAYPNFGRSCWAVAGTLCESRVQGSFAQKIDTCKNCLFFKKVVEQKAVK